MRRTDEHAGDWKEWRRLRAWQLYQQGWTQKEIGDALGASKGAVSQWIAVAEAHGFRGSMWSTTRVAELIKKRFGVSYHPSHMSGLLRRIRYSVQKPVERATQRDEHAIEAWKTEQWPALKKS